MAKLMYEVVGSFELNGDADRAGGIGEVLTELKDLLARWGSNQDWVSGEIRVNSSQASWGALRGKERGKATPPCDSSPQQAAGYSRWNSIKMYQAKTTEEVKKNPLVQRNERLKIDSGACRLYRTCG